MNTPTPAITLASDATPQEELKTLCDWVIASVRDISAEDNLSIPMAVWVVMQDMERAALTCKEMLE